MLLVYMDGVLCGRLLQSAAGDLRFVYDDDYRSRADATPISLSMPLSIAEHRRRAVLPYFNGLITDNAAAREAIARRFGVAAGNPFAILEHTGEDVAGALQIVPEGRDSSDAVLTRGRYRELTDTEVASQLRAVIDEYRDGRSAAAVLGRFSLAGAQPKTALLRTGGGMWAEPLEATPTTHILKPTAGGFRRLDVVEHMTMRAAAILGLPVAVSEVHVFDNIPTIVIERYDRAFRDGQWCRLHQEDLGQALAVAPDKKYQRHDGGPGVGDVARLFRGLPRPAERAPASWAFYQGLMFNTVIQGTDAHIKNYSVMLDRTSVRMAPLYDLATYAPYRTPDSPTYSAMRIGKEYRFDAIGTKQCLDAARQLAVDPERAIGLLDGLRADAPGAFEAARDELSHVDVATREFATSVVDSVATLPLLRRN
ncbi:HipA domain-containing protein [Gordonia sp. VNK1]